MMARYRPRAGFTLVEVLASLVIVAFALVAISATTSIARKIVRQSRDVAILAEDAATIADLMDALFRRAVFEGDSAPDGRTMDASRLTLLAFPPMGAREAGLARFDFRVERADDDSVALSVAWGPASANGQVGHGDVETIVSGAESIEFSYMSTPSAGNEAAWLPYWDDSSRMPDAVRISVRHAGARPIELVFRHVTTPIDACHVDPSLVRCWTGANG